MEQLLSLVGINSFKNAVYTFKSKSIDLLGDDEPLNIIPQIETWELEGGYRYLNLLIKVDDSWSTAFSVSYIKGNLFDITKIGNYIGERLVHSIDLSFMDGYEEGDSYFFSLDYNNSEKVLKFILEMLGDLVLESETVKDLSFTVYAPYKAFNQLKDNIEENVKDNNDPDEVKEVAQIFMEYHGEDYRSILFSDSRLVFREIEEQEIADLIEDIMFEYFSEDEVLVDQD
jgi:hypothetical protein